MKLSTQTDVLGRCFGEENAIALLIQSGFDAIDLSCFDMLEENSPKLAPDYREYAKKLRAVTEGTGVYFNQAHAPFPSSRDDMAYNKQIFQRILRAMEFCSLLGVRNIVVHPIHHLKYVGNEQALKEMNLEFYNALIPYCKDLNIHVALENMWKKNDHGIISHSVCSKVEEFKEYLDLLDSPWIVACLDIGHAGLMNADIPAFIHGLGSKLKALHVHDTGYNADLHVLPYTAGNIEWEGVLKALADSGYQGELTLEADQTLARVPTELMASASRFMAEVGHRMTRRIEYYKSLL